ncbi:MAG: TldD/PmbA family protein [Thermoplasmata archaeon]
MDFEKIIKTASAKGYEIEIFYQKIIASTVNINNHKIHSVDNVESAGLGIRALVDNRIGFAFTAETTQKAIEQCLGAAVRSAKHGKEIKNFAFPSKGKFSDGGITVSRKIKDLTPGEAIEHVGESLDAVKSVNKDVFVCEGHFGYGIEEITIANTTGLFAEHKSSACGISIFVAYPTPESVCVGFEETESTDMDFSFTEIGKNAATMAVMGKDPGKLESGKKNVILVPHAARSIIESTLVGMLQGHHAMRGESMFAGKIDKQIMNEKIQIADNGLIERSLTSAPFDDEGTPSQNTLLVKDGILKNFIFDIYSAAEYGQKTTGNGVRSMRLSAGRTYKSVPSPNFRNFVISGETGGYDELLREFAPCIVIYSVLGAHTANSITGNFAVNIPIVFEYANGEFHPRKQGMLSGNIVDYLSRNIYFTKEKRMLYGTFTPTTYVMPYILIPDAQITGS